MPLSARELADVTRVKTILRSVGLCIALVTCACALPAFAGSDAASPAPVSGLATYSARTDQRVEPYPKPGPWENEIDCVETDGKASKVWRFAHTYSTAQNGFWSTPRGNVSQDGRFYMFTSDWEDQLGQEQNGRGNRTDVFIVELR